MANFLESLGIGIGGVSVYISVSSSNFIEIVVPEKNGGIKSYAQLPIEYNEAQREIANYDKLKDILPELFRNANVNLRGANVYLNLPTVWFGYKENIPLLLDDAAITNVVLGDLEQTYIFKRKDPIPFWFDATVSQNSESRSVFYTAIQADVKAKLQEIFKEFGANLMGITCSAMSDLKGLYTTGFASAQMDDPESSWSLMIVNNSGYQMYGIQGKKIFEYYEEPLAFKSYEEEEVYSAINSAAQVALLSSPSTSIVILSETDYVSAEILAKQLQFSGTVIPVEDNKFKKEPLLDVSLLNLLPEDQMKISLQAIGSIANNDILPVNIDFLAAAGEKVLSNNIIEIPIGNGKVIELTPKKATIFASIILGIVVVPLALILLITSSMSSRIANESQDLDQQIQEIDAQLTKYEQKDTKEVFDSAKEIEKVLKNNRVKIMAYTALGESIPKNLYLTYFMASDDGFFDIQGCSNTVEDVYVFFQNLKDALFESKLRLSKLDLKAGSLDKIIDSGDSEYNNAAYVFEITNMNDSQLSSFMQGLTGQNSGKKDEKGGDAAKSNDGQNQNNNNNAPKTNGTTPGANIPGLNLPPPPQQTN